MSINSMTNEVLRRQPQYQRLAVERSATRSGVSESKIDQQAAVAASIDDDSVSKAISALVDYIPTETVTLYVAGVSAAPALSSALVLTIPEMYRLLYWGFASATPLLLLLVYFGKRGASGLPPIPGFQSWPWWKMIAACIAFLVWALAVPNNPYVTGETGPVLAGFGAIVVSTLLGLIGRIVQPAGS